jgi:p-aminobenzoyl-glutamate transporter AbgT
MEYRVVESLTLLNVGLVVSSILAVLATLWMLCVKPQILHPVKRVGLALTASGLLMAIGPAVTELSPFGQWSNIIARVGVFVLVVGYALDHHLMPRLGRLNQWNALVNVAEKARHQKQKKFDKHQKGLGRK